MKTQRQTQLRSQRTDLLAVEQQDGTDSSAFTLVELLVVIAIMTLLSALILSSVNRAKVTAQRIACINNLKQWGYATHLYANEHNDQLPREAAVDGINTWEMTGDSSSLDVWYNALAQTAGIATMAQYAQTPSSQQDFYASGKIFHCPKARFSDVAATYPNFSLAMNSKLMGDFERLEPSATDLNMTGCKIAQIQEPCRTALFLDNGVPGEERLSPFQAPYTGQPKAFASQFPGRHNRGGNIAFFDGHVLTVVGTKVVDMDPTSVFRGRAIYPPCEVIWCPDPASVP